MPSTSVEGRGIVEICPICDSEIDSGQAKCASCGFPTALLPEARKAIQEEVPEGGPQGPAPTGPEGTVDPLSAGTSRGGREEVREPASVVLPLGPSGPTAPPTTAAGLDMEKTAVALQSSLRVAQLLGMETTDVASALTNAAMAAARGAMGESLKVLQGAYDKMEPEITARFEALSTQLEEQEGRLREEGIAADVAREVSRSRKVFEEGARIEGVELLLRSQRSLNELESAWKQVKETLLRVDSLRETGQKLGMDLSKADERLGQVRETLAESNLSAATLQEAGTQASAALVLLHEQVRNQVALLGQQAIRSLKAHPPASGQREKAESRLKAILGHARAGRLKEASEEMIQFRSLFLTPESVAAHPAPPPAEARVPPEPAAEVAPAAEAVKADEVSASSGSVPSTPSPAPEAPSEPAPPEPSPSSAPEPATREAAPAETAPVHETAPPAEESQSAPTSSSPARGSRRRSAPAEAPKPAPEAEPEEGTSTAAPSTPAPRNLTEIITEARDLGLKVRDRQKKRKPIGNAATLLKEITVLVKAGKAADAELKLKEIRAELGEE